MDRLDPKVLNLSPGEAVLFRINKKLYTGFVDRDEDGNPQYKINPPLPHFENMNVFDNSNIEIVPVAKEELIELIKEKELTNKAIISLINYLNLI